MVRHRARQTALLGDAADVTRRLLDRVARHNRKRPGLGEEIAALKGETRSALSKLFREENDLKQVMKLRVIYDLLESITDRCEDVANVIEGIVLENS